MWCLPFLGVGIEGSDATIVDIGQPCQLFRVPAHEETIQPPPAALAGVIGTGLTHAMKTVGPSDLNVRESENEVTPCPAMQDVVEWYRADDAV